MKLVFDDAKKKEYLGMLADGVSKTRAAAHCGVSAKTVRDHRSKDPEFNEAIELIEGVNDDDVEAALLKKAKSGNVNAMIFYLTNRRPDEWANRQQIEHSGRGGGPIIMATVATESLHGAITDHAARRDALEYIDAEIVPDAIGPGGASEEDRVASEPGDARESGEVAPSLAPTGTE